MWQFMVEIANDLYAAGDMAWNIIRVLFAWGVIIGPAIAIATIGYVLIGSILLKISDKIEEGRNGKEK